MLVVAGSGQAMQRSHGIGRLAVKSDGTRTRLARLHQSANAKIRIPRTHGTALEAVLINTAGGIAGGDTLVWEIEAGARTETMLTTQACERVYRSTGDTATQRTRIDVGEDATLFWLPQETIVYEHGRLARSLEVSLARGAGFIGLETVIFGREAMGETVEHAFLHDRWRIHGADGALIHADDLRFDFSSSAATADPAVLGANRVCCTLVCFTPGDDEMRAATVHAVREALTGVAAGATSVGGRIVIRIAARSGYEMRAHLQKATGPILKGRALPKVWQT